MILSSIDAVAAIGFQKFFHLVFDVIHLISGLQGKSKTVCHILHAVEIFHGPPTDKSHIVVIGIRIHLHDIPDNINIFR